MPNIPDDFRKYPKHTGTYTHMGLCPYDLRDLMSELGFSALRTAKFLRVSERTVRRWLAEDSAPFSALGLLWHQTRKGRADCEILLGNDVARLSSWATCLEQKVKQLENELAHVLAISTTGAANSPLMRAA